MDLRSAALSFIAFGAFVGADLASAEERASAPPARHIGIGARVAWMPEFPGSDSSEALLLPAFDMSRGRLFLNGDGLGVRLLDRNGLSMTASLSADLLHRKQSAAPHLTGMGDVDRTAVAILKSVYRFEAWQVAGALITDVADEGHGTAVELSVLRSVMLTARLSLHAGALVRWINDEHADTFFSVDAEQSARTGLPMHRVGSGLSEARILLRANYVLAPRWILSTGAAWAELQGDAADSPIVEQDGAPSLDAVLIYRF